jgi:hypothetical protein
LKPDAMNMLDWLTGCVSDNVSGATPKRWICAGGLVEPVERDVGAGHRRVGTTPPRTVPLVPDP